MINFENWQSTGLLVVARTAKGRWCGSAQCWGDEVARKGVVCVHIDNTLVNTNNTWLNIDNTSVNEGTQSSSFHHSCREQCRRSTVHNENRKSKVHNQNLWKLEKNSITFFLSSCAFFVCKSLRPLRGRAWGLRPSPTTLESRVYSPLRWPLKTWWIKASPLSKVLWSNRC
jgi:hypothetical protein